MGISYGVCGKVFWRIPNLAGVRELLGCGEVRE